MQGVFLTLKRL